MDLFYKEYDGCLCEVKGLNNSLLATGTFRQVNDDSVEVQDKGGRLPVLAMDSKVKLVLHSTRRSNVVLAGKVYHASETKLILTSMESFADREQRRFFRLNIDHSAILIIPPGLTDAQGQPLPAKLPIRVKDVSLCGFLFECERTLSVGEYMKLSMTLIHNELETMSIVIRREVEQPNGRLAYGCEVVDLSSRVESRLNAFVLEQQQRQIRRSRR